MHSAPTSSPEAAKLVQEDEASAAIPKTVETENGATHPPAARKVGTP
jgi:hypothetical protein